MDGDEPTQATQNVLDPRRIGKQNSGFSDDDVSDIICVLYPHTDSTRQELLRLAREDSPHIIGKQEAAGVEPDYDQEDDASRFESRPPDHGNYAIILRLSSRIKNPREGFMFGRNGNRCDIVFANDPMRRVSNTHFCIYANEFGNVMIEDRSTNGTFVDTKLLCSRPKNGGKPVTKWVLTSGCTIRIYLHVENRDLSFLVRIPRRDGEYERAYIAKVDEYFLRHDLKGNTGAPMPGPPPRPAGPVDVFKTPGDPIVRRALPEATNVGSAHPSPAKRKEKQATVPCEWNGSDTYNRIKKIGKGAFAVVYKVTAKFDGKPYAAKEIEKRRFIKNGILDHKVENEMKIMKRVNHPNIVRYMDTIDWEDRLLIIIMEYVPGGDLGKLVAESGPFPELRAQTMAHQLLSALGYLHANNITHRDVKPDNILIKTLNPLDVKLTDFGLSKIVDSDQTFLTTFCGTLLYCAPEVYTEYAEYDDNGIRSRGKKMRRMPGQRYSHAVDIWSLGGVLFYTLTKSPPYPVESGITHSALLHKIMTTPLNVSPLERKGISEQAIDFLYRMLQRRPENRATIVELESHAWFGGPDSVIQASQSYDEITDDEDVIIQPSQVPLNAYEDDRVSDSAEESEKENEHSAQPRPRLFGEVASSAIGSSGALPSDLLRLPDAETASQGETEILDMQPRDEPESPGSDTAGARTRQTHLHNQTSVYPAQSEDQLLSLVEDVASQSLGGKQAETEHQNLAASRYLSLSLDANSSKRKPHSLEISDEFDENATPKKPTFKRLKSDDDDDEHAEDTMNEFHLLASVPQIRRLNSGRQVDSPVNKETFWEQDYQTWHLQYPEMTQLQYDAFVQAARDRHEEFCPGKSPLWELAMKYFPPSSVTPGQISTIVTGTMPGLRRDDRRFEGMISADIPSTAPLTTAPSGQPAADSNVRLVVPVLNPQSTGAMAMIETSPISCVQGITIPVTDTLVSFGRATENTEVFADRLQSRVPKYAFKIMLWKEGFDPSKDPAKTGAPWQTSSSTAAMSYHYWISTKATLGIRINGYSLASVDIKDPGGPARFWAKLHDGDALTIWGPAEQQGETQLIFRCFWGGSSQRRSELSPQLEVASTAMAQKLDAACAKAERRVRETLEKRRRRQQATTDYAERQRRASKERERSHAFERKRAEAIEFLTGCQVSQSGKESSGLIPLTAQSNRHHAASRFGR